MESDKTRKEFLERLDARDIVSEKAAISDESNESNYGVMKINTKRVAIKPGSRVLVVQKQHQKTNQLTEGIVKDILTNSTNHHRGIKVRLESGIIGRVQRILQ